jgi:hypothetical protein
LSLQAYGRTYLIGAAVKFVYDAQQFVGPLLLQRLVTFLQDKDTASASEGSEARVPPMRVG